VKKVLWKNNRVHKFLGVVCYKKIVTCGRI
jgi:hypothetical protein